MRFAAEPAKDWRLLLASRQDVRFERPRDLKLADTVWSDWLAWPSHASSGLK